jgi:hypothetical protein
MDRKWKTHTSAPRGFPGQAAPAVSMGSIQDPRGHESDGVKNPTVTWRGMQDGVWGMDIGVMAVPGCSVHAGMKERKPCRLARD